jgi:hypothetical protein
MRQLIAEFRKRAKNYSEEEINAIVEEAVNAVRAEENRGNKKTAD